MGIKPIFCCDRLKDMYIKHKTIWNGYKGGWFMALREQTVYDPHTFMEPINFCPFCGHMLDNALVESED